MYGTMAHMTTHGYPDEAEDRPRRVMPLERGWVRHKLQRELALGEKDHPTLAREYGVKPTAIMEFKKRHQTAIDEMIRDMEAEFKGLWIAEKAVRLAVLQQDVEELDEEEWDDAKSRLDAVKTKHNALMQAARELGQIPSTAGVKVDTPSATFHIVGVDPKALQ